MPRMIRTSVANGLPSEIERTHSCFISKYYHDDNYNIANDNDINGNNDDNCNACINNNNNDIIMRMMMFIVIIR